MANPASFSFGRSGAKPGSIASGGSGGSGGGFRATLIRNEGDDITDPTDEPWTLQRDYGGGPLVEGDPNTNGNLLVKEDGLYRINITGTQDVNDNSYYDLRVEAWDSGNLLNSSFSARLDAYTGKSGAQASDGAIARASYFAEGATGIPGRMEFHGTGYAVLLKDQILKVRANKKNVSGFGEFNLALEKLAPPP